MKRFLSLKAKIMLSALIPVVLSLVLISSVIFVSLRSVLRDSVEYEFSQIRQKYAYSFESKINNAMNYLSMLSSDIEARIEAGNTSREQLQDVVLRLFEDYGLISGSSVYFDSNMFDGKDDEYTGTQYGTPRSGRICWYYYIDGGKTSYLPEGIGNDIEFELPHYTDAKAANRPVYTDPVAHEIEGKYIPMFTLTYPINNSAGVFIGAVTVDLFLDDIYAQLQSERIYKTGYVIIANDNGKVIYSPRYGDIGKTREDAGLEYQLPAGDEQEEFFTSTSILNKKPTFVTFQTIHIPQLDRSFYISVTAPLKEINESSSRLTTFLIVLELLAIAVIAVIIYLLIRRISAPLDGITESVDKIAGGEYEARIEGNYKGEFAVVKDSVNKMADSIEAYIRASDNSLHTLKSILNGIDANIYVTAPETGEMLFINDHLKDQYEIGDDGAGRLCYEVLQERMDGRCDFCPCNQLDGEPDNVVVWEQHSDITGRDYRKTDRYIDWLGGVKAHLQHAVDITDIKRTQLELIAAKEQAEQASRSKSEFLSRMSHEMRTPMNAVIGMTSIARSSGDPEKKEHCLGQIENASRHLLGVINDILDMSKIEANKFELSFAQFEFERMISGVVDVISFRVNEKGQSFSQDIDPDIPVLLVGDGQRLAQVITNLLSNAVKFTPEGGTIRLRADKLHEVDGHVMLRIEIADSGIGISDEQRARLFRSFEQADGSIARRFGGTGLGLAISKRIVELMGGEIWFESELGRGSSFIFTMTAELGGDEPVNGSVSVKPETPENAGAITFEGKTALLAEDVDINREIVLTVLEDTKLQIDCAENGREAVELFEANPAKYDLIFMDVHMPEVDGLEATRRIRALGTPESARVPIIAMTANVFREDIERCLNAGMVDHIGKPIDFDELFEKLRKYLG